jgi:pimeloyl-ACP methyl ester carboxylesterase
MVGNVVMIKHAEKVPQSALAFARLFEEADAPKGAYTDIFVDYDQVGCVIDGPRGRGATVAGSERAGVALAERAGRALNKSVMELGGSDPLIVLGDAPMEPTLAKAIWGRTNNTAQSCVAAKRVIVTGEARGETFLAELTRRMSALRAGDSTDEATTLGPVSSEKAHRRLSASATKEIAEAPFTAGDPNTPETERLAILQKAFFARGHDARTWLEGWHFETLTMQHAAAQVLPASTYWAGGNVPMLDVFGAEDPFKPKDRWRELHDQFGDRVTTAVIAGASHALFPEKPDAVAGVILPWADRYR